jgi:NAD(P)-dependent dehydrogenase (short-subunit alcohol dehydrogenase family)
VAVIDRDAAASQCLRKALPGLEIILSAELSDPTSVAGAFNALDRQFNGLDILINNAGISIRHSFMDITSEEWTKVISINLNGVFYVAQQAAKRMLAGGSGVIINMGSTNGLAGYHYYADYNASKAGVIELTRSMALELGPKIRVNSVCPGFIMTPMQEAEYTPEMRHAFEVKVPLQRLGSPADVASLFAFLASDESSYISGQHIVIDGGEIAGGLASQA